jgi:hypothetical protein
LARRRTIVIALGFVVGGVAAATFALVRPPTGEHVDGSPDARLVRTDASVAEAAIPGSDDVFYFAYGANIDRAVFVDRRRLHPVSAEAARAPGHELIFAARGVNFVEPAFAALRSADGHDVHGVLYRLPRREVPRLHRLENGYETFYVDVVGERSGPVRAFTYDVPALTFGLKPSHRYVASLSRGARQHGLPPEYVAELERQPVTYIPILSPIAEHVVPVVEAALRDDL